MPDPTDQVTILVSQSASVTVTWHPWDAQREERSGRTRVDPLQERTVAVLVDLLHRNRLTRAEEMQLLGELLFSVLFPRERWDEPNRPAELLRRAVERAGNGRLLRITLEIDPGVGPLAAWPWEYIFLPDEHFAGQGRFLGDYRDIMLTRRFPNRLRGEREMRVAPPLRVLLAALDPVAKDLPEIHYESVLETLCDLREDSSPETRGLQLHVLAQRHKDDGTEHDGDLDEIRTGYRQFWRAVDNFKPHVIHIISHGRYSDAEGRRQGQLAFPGPDGSQRWISEENLARRLSDFATGDLRLVFLQSCEGATSSYHPYHPVSGMAQTLAQYIPAVVAMHFQVVQGVANEFARTFYEALMRYSSIEVAMHHARQELAYSAESGETDRRGFGMPVLYLREYSPLLFRADTAPRLTEHTPAGRSAYDTGEFRIQGFR